MPAPAAAPAVLTVDWASPEPSAAARQSLVEWAAARGVRLGEPRDEERSVLVADPSVGDAVEELLERARDATTAQDGAAADEALTKAEALLHAHPELPQAAWLLAEVFRARAARLRQLPPHDAVGSARAWARAASLDGGRSGGVGEPQGPEHAEANPARPPRPPASTSDPKPITIDGAPRGDGMETRVDGLTTPGGRPAGEHQVTVTRRSDGALLWAGWVPVGEDGHGHVVMRSTEPCSASDLRSATRVDGGVVAGSVTCQGWVFAEELPRPAGALAVAVCASGVCGPLLEWSVTPFGPPVPERMARGARWPAWATWTLVGAGAAAATLGTLAAAGVFRPTHDEPTFTTGGLQISAATLRAP